jgi:8-oxo-dGTP pyrophosphatase MutT (NUDIX family)
MHHIQSKILGKLLYAESLAYSQMRPEGVESNHFAYHLEQLMRADIVAKRDKRYSLSPRGLALVDRMSQEKMVGRLQPHILTVISITNAKGEKLLFKRAFQPYIHKLGFPLGKTHLEETVEQAATRELQEKTGLTGVPLAQRGIVYVHIKSGGFTITKALCHVFSGEVKDTTPAVSSDRGYSLWANMEALRPEDVMPGFLEIEGLLAAGQDGLFFAEFSVEL